MIKNTLIILVATCGMLFGLSQVAKANDYNTAVVGHIIQSKLQGNSVDTSVLEAEIHKLAHTFSLDMINVLQQHLPSILDSISAQMRADIDKKYKCALQSDDYKNKDCK